MPFTKKLDRKSTESTRTPDVYNAFSQTSMPNKVLKHGHTFTGNNQPQSRVQKQGRKILSIIDPNTEKDVIISTSPMFSNTGCSGQCSYEHTEFSNEEFNRLKMGIIVLNILADFMYDRLTLDGQHLRARKDYDISMLYNKHRNLNIHRPSNSNNRHYSPWGGTWQDIQNTDTAIGDDIERIRLIRNELHHSTTYELDDTRFIELCNIIHEMVRRFDQHNKPKVMYTKRVKEILSKAKHV
ncbi:Hypothetical predicted protein [Mytilus galloprovincialis]|uniref:DZIP3-like HEPN domain-containing protein n=1 Tax=Mytilus galloprovincialis TaxID=29158 RepID=A0A8B6HRH1_MYTGA|nr:Hypothetical predicted protein [Mytilus galloprovincialis]